MQSNSWRHMWHWYVWSMCWLILLQSLGLRILLLWRVRLFRCKPMWKIMDHVARDGYLRLLHHHVLRGPVLQKSTIEGRRSGSSSWERRRGSWRTWKCQWHRISWIGRTAYRLRASTGFQHTRDSSHARDATWRSSLKSSEPSYVICGLNKHSF